MQNALTPAIVWSGLRSASALANAATRSALEGTSFGDNLIEALPDVIGNAVGGAHWCEFWG